MATVSFTLSGASTSDPSTICSSGGGGGAATGWLGGGVSFYSVVLAAVRESSWSSRSARVSDDQSISFAALRSSRKALPSDDPSRSSVWGRRRAAPAPE